jgi:hypothetical protein
VKRISLLFVVLAAAFAALAGDSSGAASNYPTPLNFRSTVGSIAASAVLNGSIGTVDISTSNVSIDNATDNGWYVFAPRTQSSTRVSPFPSAPVGSGWLVDPAGGATGFPAGNWTFSVETVVPGATLDPGVAVLTVGMWKGTISGGAFMPNGPAILAPADDPGAHNLRASADQTTNATFPLPKFSVAAGETLYVELWRHQVGGIADAVAANRELDLVVNDGSSTITHPAADSTGPTHSFTVTPVTGSTSFTAGSNTLYFKGASAGSFTVTDTIADVGSGPLQVTFPLVSTSGWTHAAETVTSPFTSSDYSWTAGSTTSPGAQSIVGEDNALQTSTGTLTLTNDTTAPTGQSAALTGGPNFSTLSVPLTLTNGSDAGAGLDSASGVVERASATATNGSCGSFGSYATVTLVSGADTSVATAKCYHYRYTISDVLGNASSASAASSDALVDTTAPTVANAAPTEATTGADDQYFASATNTIWFRPAGAGSFTLNATPTDAESGVASVAFPDVSATAGWSGSTGGTASASPYASPQAYTWTAGATAPGAKTLTVTNKAGLTATTALTISADSTAPAGQSIALTGGPYFTTASVPLTISRGTDTGSGLDTTRDVVERASAPLTNGTCGTFGSFAAVTLHGGADTSVVSGNCYRWQLKVTDNVGNVSAASTAATADAKVDTSAPSTPALLFTGLANAAAVGNVVFFRPASTGSFTVTASASDPESGVPTYTFPSITGFTVTGTGASRTFSFSSAVSAPLAPISVTATNGDGLTSPAATFTLVPDPGAPALIVRCNKLPCSSTKAYAGAVTVTATATDTPGSGLDSIRYTTTGADPTPDEGLEYSNGLIVRELTTLKFRAYDVAGNASALVTVTIHSLADRLVFGAPLRVSVRPTGRYLQARVSSTKRARVLATMSGRGLKTPHRWRFTIGTGASIVQLRLPTAAKRPGTYNVRWTVTAGTKRAVKLTHVTLRR